MAKQFTNKTLTDKLYKYRDWNNPDHRRLLTHRELYFAKPSSFNDPFDGNIPVRWDRMTYDDCVNKNLGMVKVLHADKPHEIQLQMAKNITDEGTLWHPGMLKKEVPEQIAKWDGLIGLATLSEKRDDILMWSHYAGHHTGFVVGFDADAMNSITDFDYLDEMDYMDEYPVISGNDDMGEQFRKKFFCKSKMWSYEREWRITKNHIKNRVYTLSRDAFCEVVIGCRTSEEASREIISVVRQALGSQVRILRAKRHEEKFALEISD